MDVETAWKHVKALWPGARRMEKNDGNVGCFIIDDETGFEGHIDFDANIDWPEGVSQWPPPEPQYREPKMPEDFDKEIEVGDYPNQWFPAKLAGVANELYGNPRFFAADGVTWRHARIRVDDDETWKGPGGHIFNKQGECKCGHSTGDDPDRCPFDDGWKTMESAPKDGTEVLVLMGGEEHYAVYSLDEERGKPIWLSILTSEHPRRNSQWDRANQPTAWKEIE